MDLLVSCIGEKDDIATILGLVAIQLLTGSFAVVISKVLSLGLNPLFIIIFDSLLTAIILSPVAFFLEKGKRPSKLSPRLLIHFLCISLGGVAVFQPLVFLGNHKTSPPIASALLNLSPALVFLIAWFLRLEMVDLRSGRSWAKIGGTLICLGGAVALAFLRGPPISHWLTSQAADNDMIIGFMYLLVAVFTFSSLIILQSTTLILYPAPLSLCAITFWLGSVFTSIVHVVQKGGFDMGCSKLSPAALLGVVIMGALVNGMSFSFHAWSIKKKGPVLVSIFHPISTIWSAILSSILLGYSLRLGSIIGMVLVFIGLFLLLWGKNKDGYGQQEKMRPLLG